jgi:hypothetical protein
MKRATAETMLAAVIERAKAINRNPELLCSVRELRVFGSYLTDSPSLGDLDIAYRLVRRPSWTAEAALARADLMIPSTGDFIRRLTYYETEIKQILRNRSGYISLHRIEEIVELACASRIVFEDTDTVECLELS